MFHTIISYICERYVELLKTKILRRFFSPNRGVKYYEKTRSITKSSSLYICNSSSMLLNWYDGNDIYCGGAVSTKQLLCRTSSAMEFDFCASQCLD